MPIYEFTCENCGEGFEELVRSSESVSEVACPACRSRRVRKQISLIAARTGVRSTAAPATAACTTST
jgi:putative FmdB family regulatory protein